jgi:hypothetical protein
MTRPLDDAKSKEKEILVVDSYAKTPQQRETLASALEAMRSLGRDIFVVSHLPIPEGIINSNVKFTVYDTNNILGPNPTFLSWKIGDLEVRWPPPNDYHGAAVYANLNNALRLLTGRYERVHFVESDIGVDAISVHLDRATYEFTSRPDVQVVGYSLCDDDPARASNALLTNLISLKPQVVERLPCVSSWGDYASLASAGRLIFEE